MVESRTQRNPTVGTELNCGENEFFNSLLVGFVCAAMLAVGFGFVVPVSSVVGDVFDVLAVGAAILFVGLLDGE